MLERFREDDDQSSGLDYAKLDDEDLMRREETHESVMNYNDYASQPHIQQFHADMDRIESAEDYRKGGEEDDDGEDSHGDEISHEPQIVPRLVHSLTESPSSPPGYLELFKVLQTLSWIRWPVSPS
ncbi:hypothetical protein K4K52_004460 [Colletotrichum sp. SAR 10_76]|nr:hypothetical protein K4K52_004460 [Colletotrichum sp. SAR 10_76]